MKTKNKIAAALGFCIKKPSVARLLNNKLLQATALSISCMVALPSFAQSPCPGNPTTCELPPGNANPPTGGTGNWGSGGSGSGNNNNSGGGCWYGDPSCNSGDDDGNDGGNNQSPQCSSLIRTELRQRRQEIPSCNGDPGHDFDENAFLSGEAFMLWNGGVIPMIPTGTILNDIIPAFEYLSTALEQNNSDMGAAYHGFEQALWSTCNSNHGSNLNGSLDDCWLFAYNILEGYGTGISTAAYIVGWFTSWQAGIGIEPIDWTTNWGGRFQMKVTNHYLCHEVYQAWDEENCSGAL